MRNWQLPMAPALPMATCISMYRILHSILNLDRAFWRRRNQYRTPARREISESYCDVCRADAHHGSRETVMDHFGFKVRNIQQFIDKWESAGLEMGRVFTGAEGQTNAYVTLPDGVYVELQEDQGLHEEFTGYHIHYFTQDYESLLDWYVEIFDLEISTGAQSPRQQTCRAPI